MSIPSSPVGCDLDDAVVRAIRDQQVAGKDAGEVPWAARLASPPRLRVEEEAPQPAQPP